MNFRKSSFPIMLALFVLAIGSAHATCEIDDIVSLVDDGEDAQAIRDQCDRRVTGAGNCAFSKVMRLAESGRDASEIEDACTKSTGPDVPGGGPSVTQSSPVYCCATVGPAAGMRVCQITVNPGPIGSPCFCYGVPGAGATCN